MAAPPEGPRRSEPVTTTRQIYLCKGYSGGMFWSSEVCSTQRAHIDRIVTVPAHYSWEQAVAAGEHERRAAASLYGPREHPAPAAGRGATPGAAARDAECTWIRRRIAQIDALARQPQTGSTQDRLRAERQTLRSREAELRC